MTEPVRPEDMRVSDADREVVQRTLRQAHEAGRLDLGEFDERVRTAWAARTRGELQRITADLPEPPSESRRRPIFTDTGGGVTMKVLTIVWSSLTAVNLVVWGLVAVSTGTYVYPWWLWVAVPPGAALAVLYAAGIGRPRRE